MAVFTTGTHTIGPNETFKLQDFEGGPMLSIGGAAAITLDATTILGTNGIRFSDTSMIIGGGGIVFGDYI